MTLNATPADVRAALLARREIALLDVREEDPYAQAHPLWAANLPLSKLELEAYGRIPRRDTAIVVYDDGEGFAQRAADRLRSLGYTDVRLLAGGLAGWREAGGELFRDVNVPSKSFGELVEAERHTPSLVAEEVKALLDAQADVVVLDARRFDEYQTMSIPTATSVPGAELVLRARALAPDPATRVIVNCAGRTRSIIGTQSLVNAGLPNPVAALRNGTIGWKLAGLQLDHGQQRRPPAEVPAEVQAEARRAAAGLAQRAGVLRIGQPQLDAWQAESTRTTYAFDVRTPEEYAAGHRPGFRNAPGGQLVQETDHHAPVRGARIVLVDDGGDLAEAGRGVRAAMTASWLAQMGWEVALLEGEAVLLEARVTGPDVPPLPPLPAPRTVAPATLADWLASGDGTVVIDVTTSANHVKRHIPGAWWTTRAVLAEALQRMPPARRYVLTCGSSLLARFAAEDLQALTDAEVWVLEGGNAAWVAAGLPTEPGEQRLAAPRIDRYRRPYEGTDAPASAMQAYLDWEFGLVEQLGRDGTHHFRVLEA
ncbi:rhodanese-related sulfurtransferase [Aquincola tertiaricarbonis]|uniref:rhodanese-related sulfurtransferase n=1 Tax=Aquincola tertiaricarbonis TaxID=391953 RepID=UPI000614E3CE|nr:rhodanese-related sulfurtransferase [Aquincola tertiaricarbonis]